MTTRSEREKAQKLNEQHQAILTKLLREDDNKYCADCEAKGPRWASWNLGVFMCIRCAGIHRNLGVHISRVKSVNLDQWTPEQIQSMVDMGNQRAKLLYEAHLPEGFRRPQTDQAVEVFIRDKYERKKYYDQEALASVAKPSEAAAAAAPSSPSSSQADRTRLEKERDKKKEEKKERDADKHNVTKAENKSSPKESSQPAVDLLGLDTPVGGAKGSGGGQELDIFGPMVSNPLPAQSASATAPPQAVPSSTSTPNTSTSSSSSTKTEQKKLLSKDSILSLYASSPVASQTHNQQQQQQAASGQAALYGAQFPPQGFGPSVGGAAPPSTMMGGGPMMGLANGSYMGVQQQQGQWGVAQMTQQMSGVAVSGGAPPTTSVHQSGGPGAAAAAAAAATTWPAAPATSSGQTLSTQLWK